MPDGKLGTSRLQRIDSCGSGSAAYLKPMGKLFTTLIAFLFTAFPALAEAVEPDLDRQVHCAVVFGIVAGEQQGGKPGSDRFPAMNKPGKAFFVATGLRLIEERKLPIEQMEPYFIARVREVQSAIAQSPDPARTLEAEYARCLPLFALDAPDAAPKDR